MRSLFTTSNYVTQLSVHTRLDDIVLFNRYAYAIGKYPYPVETRACFLVSYFDHSSDLLLFDHVHCTHREAAMLEKICKGKPTGIEAISVSAAVKYYKESNHKVPSLSRNIQLKLPSLMSALVRHFDRCRAMGITPIAYANIESRYYFVKAYTRYLLANTLEGLCSNI